MVSDGLGGMSYRRSYAGRRGNVRRDAMGRYSRAEGDFMAENTIKSRIQLKNDTEANWDKATNFVPK